MICIVDEVVAGMKTEEDVTAGGRVLLPRGTVLTENHIAAIKKWGVYQIIVEGEDPLAQRYQQNAMDEIAGRFKYANSTFAVELHKAVARWILRQKKRS